MALLDPTYAVPGARRAGLVARLFGAINDWNVRRQTRTSLSRLSALDLADIGLDHGDIDVVAEGRRRGR